MLAGLLSLLMRLFTIGDPLRDPDWMERFASCESVDPPPRGENGACLSGTDGDGDAGVGSSVGVVGTGTEESSALVMLLSGMRLVYEMMKLLAIRCCFFICLCYISSYPVCVVWMFGTVAFGRLLLMAVV